jgi:hypothetical protein
MELYTVYVNPKDYPCKVVVRRMEIYGFAGVPIPDREPWFVGTWLDDARKSLPDGLTCIKRHRADDPVIVEVWL